MTDGRLSVDAGRLRVDGNGRVYYNDTPVAQIGASNTTPAAGDSITLYDQASDPNSDLTSWSWSFDDGNTASGSGDKSHTYSSSGTYNPSLTVADVFGVSDSAQVQIDVQSSATGLFTSSDSYTTNDTPQAVSIDESTGTIDNLIFDNPNSDANGVTFTYSSGTTRTFNFDYTSQSMSGSGDTQLDRRHTLFEAFDTNDNFIFAVAIQAGSKEIRVYDSADGTSGWDTLNDSSNSVTSGISYSNLNNIKAYWDGSAWVISLNNGSWTYTVSHYNGAAGEVRIGLRGTYSNHGNTIVHEYKMVDTT